MGEIDNAIKDVNTPIITNTTNNSTSVKPFSLGTTAMLFENTSWQMRLLLNIPVADVGITLRTSLKAIGTQSVYIHITVEPRA